MSNSVDAAATVEAHVQLDPERSTRARSATSNPWGRFARQRLGGLILSFCVLLTVTFLIVPLIPGDPAAAVAGESASAEDIARIHAEMGLDDSLPKQFLDYVHGVLTFDLGTSFVNGQSVQSLVFARMPYTAELALAAIMLVLLVAVPTGMCVAMLTHGGRRSWLDHGFNVLTSFLYSVPQYVLATFLVATLAVGMGVFPAGGAASPRSFVLPTISLMVLPACVIARIVRREVAVVLHQDYVRTARGWRIGFPTMLMRYVLPNVLTTTLTLSGLILAGMLGGAIVIETVFAWPGLGQGIVQAILARDYPVIRGTVLVLGLIATLIIIVVDTILAIVDPRTLEGSHG